MCCYDLCTYMVSRLLIKMSSHEKNSSRHCAFASNIIILNSGFFPQVSSPKLHILFQNNANYHK